jgi:hypothetical protein
MVGEDEMISAIRKEIPGRKGGPKASILNTKM